MTGTTRSVVAETRELRRHAALLIHGLGGSPIEMKVVKTALERAGYAVDVPVLPGHGTHYSDLRRYTWDAYTHFVEERFEQLRERHESVSVSGLCMGAVLALHLGIRFGARVKAIAPISTTLFFDGWGLPKATRLLPLWRCTPAYYLYDLPESDPFGVKDARLRRLIARHISDASTTHYSKIPFRAFWQMYLLNARVRAHLHELRSPVHAIHPIEDEVASPRSVDFMRAHIDPALFSSRLLDDCYHLATIDRQRHLVSASIRDFFEAHAEAPRVRLSSAADAATPKRHALANPLPSLVTQAGAAAAAARVGWVGP